MKVYVCILDGRLCCVFAAKSDAHTWLLKICIERGCDPNYVNGLSFDHLNDICYDGCDYYVEEATILGTYNPPETYELSVPKPQLDRTYQVYRM